MRKERIIYLDLIRILSFLMVTAYHFSVTLPMFGITANVKPYFGVGRIVWSPIAVSAFFMVSGAALMYRYREQCSLKEYYINRFKGIYPLFWLAYLIVFMDFFYRVRSMPDAPKVNFLLSVIGMDGYFNDKVATFYMVGEWFLGALIAMYILFPLYRAVMLKCKYILPPIFFGIGLWLYKSHYEPLQRAGDVKKDLFVCSMYLTLGMMIELIRENADKKKTAIALKCAAGVGLVGSVLVCASDRIPYPYSTFCLTVTFYLLIMEIAQWIKGRRARAVITTISRHSYAYFLLHHWFLHRYTVNFAWYPLSDGNTLLLFVSSIVHIYILAVLLDKLYAYISKSLRRWKDGAA